MREVTFRPAFPLCALIAFTAAAMSCGRGSEPSNPPDLAAHASPPANTPEVEHAVRGADEQAVRDADQAFLSAVEAGDDAGMARALDYDDFSWITPAGVKLSRAAVVSSPPHPALPSASGAALEARRLGTHIVVAQRHSGNTHAMHVWVRRDVGWRLLHVRDVIEGERVVYGGTMIGAANCINPCKVVPFVPAKRAVGKPFWGSRVFELRNGTWIWRKAIRRRFKTTRRTNPDLYSAA